MLDVVVDCEVLKPLPELLDALFANAVARAGPPQVMLRDHLLHQEGRHVLQTEAFIELIAEAGLRSVALLEVARDSLADVVLDGVLELVEANLP